MTSRRRAPTWMVLGLLLVFPLAFVQTTSTRAQDPPPALDTTILATSRVEVDAPSTVTVSAATITMVSGQRTLPVTARGTVLVLVEVGRVRIQTDAALPGVERDDADEPGALAGYRLSIGQRVTLPPGATIIFGNEEAEPSRVFLVTFVPIGDGEGADAPAESATVV